MFTQVSSSLQRAVFWVTKKLATTDRSRRGLRSLSLSLLLLALFITLITVARGTLLIVNFIGAFVVQNHLFPGDKLTNDLKSNASSTEEDALPSSSSRTETHHFCRRCGRMFGNKSYPPVLFGALAARP